MAIVDPTKDSPSRTVHVRLLGFTSDTKGYLMQTDDGTQHKTEQVAFDKDLHRPWSNGYSKEEDDMARRAVDPDPRLVDLHTIEPNDHGIPVGLDDDCLETEPIRPTIRSSATNSHCVTFLRWTARPLDEPSPAWESIHVHG